MRATAEQAPARNRERPLVCGDAQETRRIVVHADPRPYLASAREHHERLLISIAADGDDAAARDCDADELSAARLRGREAGTPVRAGPGAANTVEHLRTGLRRHDVHHLRAIRGDHDVL